MTDVARQASGNLPASRLQDEDTKADKARKTFGHIRRQFLAPFDAWERSAAVGAEERSRMIDRPAYLVPRVYCPTHPATEEQRQQQLSMLDAALANQPDIHSLQALRHELDQAASGAPIPAANRMIVGAMVAAFPNVRPHSPEYYLEALIEALGQLELPPAAVAKTCNEIYQTATFAPTAAEVLAKAKEVHGKLVVTVKQIDRYGEILAWADEVRSWIKTVPLLAPNRSNFDRPPAPPPALSFSPSRTTWV